jgi:hypothetical protein
VSSLNLSLEFIAGSGRGTVPATLALVLRRTHAGLAKVCIWEFER